jgi:hypothetical protein
MANDVKDFGDYSVKNVKSFVGMEGYGFNCTLYRNGKKVGICIDDASGGGMHPIRWDQKVNAKEEQRLLNKHVASLPKVKSDLGDKTMTLTIDEGWFVEELVSQYEKEREIRKVKRQCETKTLFRTADMKEGVYSYFRVPYSEKLKAHIINKYGEAVEIFNEVFEKGKVPSIF